MNIIIRQTVTGTLTVENFPTGREVIVQTDADLQLEFWNPTAREFAAPLSVSAPQAVVVCPSAKVRITTTTTANVNVALSNAVNADSVKTISQSLTGTEKAVARSNIGAQATHIVDPRDYGAYFDRVHDDTLAIQAAIDAAEAGNVRAVLIPGKALITAPLVLQATELGIHLVGISPRVSEIYQDTAASDCIQISDAPGAITVTRERIAVSRIQLTGKGAGVSTGIGLRLKDTTDGDVYNGGFVAISDVSIIGFGTGLDHRRWDNTRYIGLKISACATGAIFANFTKTVTVINSVIANSTVKQLECLAGSALAFIGCDFGGPVGGSQVDILISGEAVFDSCNFERCGSTSEAIIDALANSRIAMRDCVFNGGSSTKPAVRWAATGHFQNLTIAGFGTGGGKLKKASASATGGVSGNAGLASNRQTCMVTIDNAGQFDAGPFGCFDIVRSDSLSTAVAANRGLLQMGFGTGTAADRIGLMMFDGSAYQRAALGLVETKATTGDPASGHEGRLVINTFDNTLKFYADGGWRTLATW